MKIRSRLKELIRRFGYAVFTADAGARVYDSDALMTVHDHSFLEDPAFKRAYARGVRAAAGDDYGWYWRVHIGLWAAATAVRLEGDFVECGVNRGFMSSAIMESLDWDRTGKTFYLLDTFGGLPSFESKEEFERNRRHIEEGFYVTNIDEVKANFAQWSNIRLIQGAVPETLAAIGLGPLAFLHLDMNAPQPEVAALETLWDRLTKGAIVLLDDYAYNGFEEQKRAMESAAGRMNISIASLPTGQGLIVKT